ncbi:MAG: hypothetical protein ACJA1B_001893 [Polaribacter sp.]|jgi:hypothetical protein
MTLKNALNFFESLKRETTKKTEIQIYEKFIYTLTKLENREFSKEEIQSIESELDSLQLESNPENKKKIFKKALSKFENYLKDTFTLTNKGYYTQLYGGLGLSFGIMCGVAILSNFGSLGISLGLIGGMVIGSIIGRKKDAEVKAAGNML